MTSDPSDELRAIAAVSAALHAPAIARDAEALQKRLAEGRVYVACIGQFKRGKSTLINALAGAPILPTGVLPVTSAVTIVRYGRDDRMAVHFRNGNVADGDLTAIASYVSEEQNHENEKGVVAVEVFLDRPLLADGLCLVDTPGLGSVFAGNTAATKEFLPHIDAALVVLGADPPLSAEEAVLVEEIGRQTDELIVVLNKADRSSADDLQAAATFTRDVLGKRLGRTIDCVYVVSATERDASPRATGDWIAFQARLAEIIKNSKPRLVAEAARRGTQFLLLRLLAELDAQTAALIEPLSTTESKIEALTGHAAGLEKTLRGLKYQLQQEQDTLHQSFACLVQDLVARLALEAEAKLHLAIAHEELGPVMRLRRQAVRFAQATSETLVQRDLPRVFSAAEKLYAKTTRRFAEIASSFFDEVTAVEVDHVPSDSVTRPVVEETFRVPSRFYHHAQDGLAPLSPWRSASDLLKPRAIAMSSIERDVLDFLRDLLETNGTLILNDLDQLVVESRRRLEGELHDALENLRIAAHSRLARARVILDRGEDAVRFELDRLGSLKRQLAPLAEACPL